MKRMLWLIGLLLTLCFLSSCNTLRGVGRDIQWTGEQIQDVAD